MSTTEQYFEVIVDYGGVEGDANYIAVKKGDQVRLIKKSKEWITIEKDGHIGKVPKRILDRQNQRENKKQGRSELLLQNKDSRSDHEDCERKNISAYSSQLYH
ncbi:MAG: hypothetical protein EZS28_025919 [Streblomastix strix]|uniref:SH3 domain-containing protein n=1 Tax=Streblomastix strix TaxID=222440 RepID=A0A5J4V853_9EUKA|nr:MAG: hypothetical protein EZS28_025919 [Streblomastix strix]